MWSWGQRQRGTASGSGANQPASEEPDNVKLVWNKQFFIAELRIMSYNVGADQAMLGEGPF